MSIQVTPAFVTFFIFVCGYFFTSVWWASSLTTSVRGFSKKLDEMIVDMKVRDKHIEDQIQALWKKHDELKKKVDAI